jgi:serine/threonine-protein kinase SIK3
VDRSDPPKPPTPSQQEALDRLSPLTNMTLSSIPGTTSGDLEKFVDFDSDMGNNSNQRTPETTDHLFPQVNTLGQTRRHTVGPGDVAHEQALANPTTPINFKFGGEAGTNIPTNLPMLQNQPLHNFTIKDQHLLKPPIVMGASEFIIVVGLLHVSIFFFLQQVHLDVEHQMAAPIYTFTIRQPVIVKM